MTQASRHDGPERRPDELVVDQIADQLERTVSLLRGSVDQAAERALARFGGQLEVETRIVAELADRRPLVEPNRFLEAHQIAMHALEVLDRDGSGTRRCPAGWGRCGRPRPSPRSSWPSTS